jgi:hypothetical protein
MEVKMNGLTENEARAADLLVRNFSERNSINRIGRMLKISPRGAYKVLKKLEKGGAIVPEKIGNAIYYRPNTADEPSKKLLEFVMSQNSLNRYSQLIADDLKPLRQISYCCVLFGSVIDKGRDANDIDVLLVIDKNSYRSVRAALEKIKALKAKKIHEVVQTREDLLENVRKRDSVIIDIIRKGQVLWGAEEIVEAIKDGSG